MDLATLKQELQVVKGAPISLVIFMVFSFGSGYAACRWYYSKQLSDRDGLIVAKNADLAFAQNQLIAKDNQLAAKENQLSRYRVELSLENPSRGVLVDLTNQELAVKSQAVVKKLREFADALETKFSFIQQRIDEHKINKNQALRERKAAADEVSQEMDRNLASDADNLRTELRRRLDPKAIANVLRVPALRGADGSSNIPFTALFRGTGFDMAYTRTLSNEIEEMTKLLPPDSH